MAGLYSTITITCEQCGKLAERPYRGSGVRPTLCGKACRMVRYWARHPEKKGASYRKAIAARPPRLCACGSLVGPRKRKCHECRRASDLACSLAHYRKARGDVRCPDCGVPIANDGSYQRRCEPCRERRASVQRRVGRQTRKHRERAAIVERFDPVEVLERDGWRCHLCGRKTPKQKRGTFADNAPELDHIVPIAKGGAHSRANTACACRKCNIAKSDRIVGQPSLFAA